MARENQGLQIALIAFVMLAIILGVTTFIFYRNYDEATIKAVASDKDKAAAEQKVAEVEREKTRFKELIGAAATDQLDAVEKAFNTEMQTYGASIQGTKTYRNLIQYLNDAIQKKNIELASEKTINEDLSKQLKAREGIAQPKIDKALAEAKDRTQELAAERQKFDKDRTEVTTQKGEIAGKLDKTQKESAAATSDFESKKAVAIKRYNDLKGVAERLKTTLEKKEKPTFEVATGKITWVNQRDRVVWIDLGQADSLNTLTSFSVYGSDTTNVSGAEKKASIEVTEIVGSHLAKARILEDKNSDPIVPGDVIYTPIWSRGEKRHFALAGVIDTNGDGKSDLARVINLIQMNNGVVDAYQDAKGKRVGKITPNTRFFIEGQKPEAAREAAVDPAAEKAWIDNFTFLQGEADRNLVKKKTLTELLSELGDPDQDRVVQFGRGATAPKIQPDPNPRTSGGSVTPLFQPRQPPHSSARGAY